MQQVRNVTLFCQKSQKGTYAHVTGTGFFIQSNLLQKKTPKTGFLYALVPKKTVNDNPIKHY